MHRPVKMAGATNATHNPDSVGFAPPRRKPPRTVMMNVMDLSGVLKREGQAEEQPSGWHTTPVCKDQAKKSPEQSQPRPSLICQRGGPLVRTLHFAPAKLLACMHATTPLKIETHKSRKTNLTAATCYCHRYKTPLEPSHTQSHYCGERLGVFPVF